MCPRRLLPLICLVFPAFAAPSAAAPILLRVGEGFENPLGFHDPEPVFSWQFQENGPISRQTACQIVVASDPALLPGQPDLWDSGKLETSQSAWLPYAGPAFTSRQRAHWMVRVWNQDGQASAWSSPASLEMGLLSNNEWKASWIHLAPQAAAPVEKPVVVEIRSAVYGVPGEEGKGIDLTGKLRGRQKEENTVVTAGNELAGGDPRYGVKKELRVVVVRDGREEEIRLAEGQGFDVKTGRMAGERPIFIPQRLRREFDVDGRVQSARLHLTARGLVRAHLNGRRTDASEFLPGWTPYAHKIETVVVDVTGQVRPGRNTIGLELAEGWYAGRLGWGRAKGVPPVPMVLAQLEITFADGRNQTIPTDATWKATDDGPIRFSGIYDGEIFDARRETRGWTENGYDDSAWRGVTAIAVDDSVPLRPKRHAPVREQMTLPARRVGEPEPGRFVFDLGQNIVGWARLKIPVTAGRAVTVRYAEMTEKDGRLYTANYRSAKSINEYIPAATGTIEWQPSFTFHGFRHVEISGLPDGVKPDPSWVTGVVLHSGFAWTGSFVSSHGMLNQLQSNIQWGLRGNFLEIPTDCPQRDERLGWTGDIQVFTPTAIFNADVHAFLASWLESMRLDQEPDGSIPSVVPDILNDRLGGPGWSDAATIVPWEVHVRTGDIRVLRENFGMMKAWTEWCRKNARDSILDVRAYGDWLQPHNRRTDNKGDTPFNLIGTAYFARSAELTARAARVLGNAAEAGEMERLRATVAAAFTARFFDGEGKLTTEQETQTGYLLALGFDLLPPERRQAAAGHLARLVREADGHLRTGFLGTPLLAPVLEAHGHRDLAYGALFKETYPSWFYSIHQGATTMWERWNSYSHENGFGDAGMNSFNHYAYGAIGQWMVESVAGLAPDPESPGYRHFFIQPRPGGPLETAAAELRTPHGRARSAWEKKNAALHLEAVVPPNTTATLRLEGDVAVTRDNKPIETKSAAGLTTATLDPGTHRLVVTPRP